MALSTRSRKRLEVTMANRVDAKEVADAIDSMIPTVQMRTVTVGFAQFAGLGVADVATFNLGAALPAGARIVGHEIVALTPFNDGGGNPDVTVQIGDTSAVDSIVTALNVAHDGSAGAGTSGAAGYPMAAISGTATLKFTTNNAAHMVGLDAGAVTANILFVVPV
jgi:hypothetical protein